MLRASLLVALFCATIPLHSQQAASPPSKEPQPNPTQPAIGTVPVITPGKLIKRVAPKYPKQARKQHVQGTVVMNGTITKDGDVTGLQLVSGDPLLAQAAMDAVKQWKYRPYLSDGKPVAVDTTITVNFETH